MLTREAERIDGEGECFSMPKAQMLSAVGCLVHTSEAGSAIWFPAGHLHMFSGEYPTAAAIRDLGSLPKAPLVMRANP